ncbi:MAG TPA: helix-turn-helix domain-containing protein [Lacipirellulaceae bacterium]|nr:helix-turn-helix domain-containing protein [Lacipirellulaceae bacterium]
MNGDTNAINYPGVGTLDVLAVDAAEAARLCGVSRTSWYGLQAAGRLPRPVRLGRRVVWRVEELKAWLAAGCPPLAKWQHMREKR